jgi:hypothetical protein
MKLLLTVLLAVPALAQDPPEIFRRSIEKDQLNRTLGQQYTFIEKSVQKRIDKDGHPKKTESAVHDVSILYGHRYRRLIEKDGKPLNAQDLQTENDRLEKFTMKWTHETPEERSKRLAQSEKNREKTVSFLKEIPDAYDLRLVGEEKIDGKDAWVIQGEPHPGYRPKVSAAKFFAKIHGRIWIDKAEYQWLKVDAETTDTISFGLILFRLYKGSRLQFEQTHVNDEIWLPRMQHIQAGGRMGIFLKASYDGLITYENYRKFQSDSKIISVGEEK